MSHNVLSLRIVRPALVTASLALGAVSLLLAPQAAHAQANTFFQVAGDGTVSALSVNNIANPASQYQIQNLSAGDVANGASYDPINNRLYYVRNLTNDTTQLWFLQFDANGAVLGENLARNLPATLTVIASADYYNGRVWLLDNGTNIVRGYDVNNILAAPIVVTLPVSPGNPSTLFNGGDMTFDDSGQILYVSGNHGTLADSFIYKYDISNLASPTFLARRDYASSAANPFFNGIAFSDDTDILYGYFSTTADMYRINTTTLVVAQTIGTNPELAQGGDLAGFAQFEQISSAVPEPGSLALLLPILGTIGIRRRAKRRVIIGQLERS